MEIDTSNKSWIKVQKSPKILLQTIKNVQRSLRFCSFYIQKVKWLSKSCKKAINSATIRHDFDWNKKILSKMVKTNKITAHTTRGQLFDEIPRYYELILNQSISSYFPRSKSLYHKSKRYKQTDSSSTRNNSKLFRQMEVCS